MTVGNFLLGSSSDAMGIIKAYSATSITVEMLQGIFDSSETISEYDNEECTGTPEQTATLDSVTTASLSDTYPIIVRAAEIQIRWCWQQKTEFGLTNSSRDGQVQRRDRARNDGDTQLIEEVQSLLTPYRRYLLA